jgi:drug/metabolite transporter (DMT)-like permease
LPFGSNEVRTNPLACRAMEPPDRRSPRAGPLVACLAAALLFGASTPASKRLLGEDALGPFTLAGLLYVGAAIAVAPWALRGASRLAHLDRANARRLATSVVAGGIVAPVLLLLGLRDAPASSVAIWLTLEGFLTAVLARLFFREHMGARTWVAVAAAFLANAAVALPGGVGSWRSALLVAGACLCWGIDNNVTATLDGPTPAQTTMAKGAIAGTSNLLLAIVLVGEPWRASATTAATALAIGAGSFGASLVLYVASAQQLGAARSQVIFSASPFLGLALAWTAFGEPVHGEQVAASVVVAAAIALMTWDRHGHVHTHPATKHTHGHRHDDGHHTHAHPGLDPSAWHVHEHEHEPLTHDHAHHPDVHHRHAH